MKMEKIQARGWAAMFSMACLTVLLAGCAGLLGGGGVSIGQASEQSGKWDSGLAMLVNNLTHVEIAVPKEIATQKSIGTGLFTGKKAIIDQDVCAVWQESESGIAAITNMFSPKLPDNWQYCYQLYATDPTKNYAGMFGNFKQTWAKEGDKDEYILLVHLPPGKYLLSAWGPVPDDMAKTYMSFTDTSAMPVIEVKPHEVTLVGELKTDKNKRESVGRGMLPYLQSYKLYTSADDKKKILDLMKTRLEIQAKETKYNEKRAERWKAWLPAVEAAAAKAS